MLAVAAVLIPSPEGGIFILSWPELSWARTASILVLNISALGAAGFSILLVRRPDPGAGSLAVLVALMGLAIGLATVDQSWVAGLVENGAQGLRALLWATVLLGIGAWVRFSATFPVLLNEEDLYRVARREASLEVGWDFPTATEAYRKAGAAWRRRFPRVSNALRTIRAPLIWLDEKLQAVASKPATEDKARGAAKQLMTISRRIWWIVGAVAVASFALTWRGVGWAEGVSFVAIGPFFVVSTILFGAGFALVDQQRRDSALWVYQGLSLGLIMCTAVPGTIAVMVWVVGLDLWYLGIAMLVAAAGPLVLVSCLAIAVFWEGVLDPRLAIRRTTVYGTLGVLFIILFAVVESLVSEFVEARLGLPNMAGAATSGALVAAIVLPLRGRFSRAVNRLIPLAVDRPDAHHGPGGRR